jgi:hypothetical protein
MRLWAWLTTPWLSPLSAVIFGVAVVILSTVLVHLSW